MSKQNTRCHQFCWTYHQLQSVAQMFNPAGGTKNFQVRGLQRSCLVSMCCSDAGDHSSSVLAAAKLLMASAQEFNQRK